jgi:hypothetical protein
VRGHAQGAILLCPLSLFPFAHSRHIGQGAATGQTAGGGGGGSFLSPLSIKSNLQASVRGQAGMARPGGLPSSSSSFIAPSRYVPPTTGATAMRPPPARVERTRKEPALPAIPGSSLFVWFVWFVVYLICGYNMQATQCIRRSGAVTRWPRSCRSTTTQRYSGLHCLGGTSPCRCPLGCTFRSGTVHAPPQQHRNVSQTLNGIARGTEQL